MRHVAFLTMDSLEAFVAYDHLAVAPLRARGWDVTDVPWRADVDWSRFEAVVIRTPWDYQDAPEDFLAVLEAIEASGARLANDLRAVRWNLTKTYLREMEAAGVTIVPTTWGERLTPEALDGLFRQHGSEIVIKPIVGANADNAFRLTPEADASGALRTFAAKRFMAQPFVRSVVERGEFSLFFFHGAYSHAILKTPAPRDFRVQEEHGGTIRAIQPEPSLLEAADRALAAAPEELLYARPDFVRMPDGTWALMELEIIEPSLYFPYDAASPERFAEAFVRWVDRPLAPEAASGG
ncbi:ATP-grasp domain-containing protein [Rubricoccus marinus]|uniref:Prokaryotic glutathione synthetase ATP-binding domain-containing protein n=1 Tax=Rubricoccus marinus TaxID=716817 RepID=A0A259U008_9BACT|nr:hypothetical protein [Rubricoccus marinus]OZC03266.1 hypothetical protein BSZ36_09920 [Rubricoccus marinus]